MNVISGSKSTDFIPKQRAKKQANELSAVRLLFDNGKQIDSGQAYNHMIRIDGIYEHAADSMVRVLENEDGEVATSVHLLSNFDETVEKDFEIIVQNSLSSFP